MKTRVINERSIRRWLNRRGYNLIKLHGPIGGYMVAKDRGFPLYGNEICPVSLEDISAWIDENKEGVA